MNIQLECHECTEHFEIGIYYLSGGSQSQIVFIMAIWLVPCQIDILTKNFYVTVIAKNIWEQKFAKVAFLLQAKKAWVVATLSSHAP